MLNRWLFYGLFVGLVIILVGLPQESVAQKAGGTLTVGIYSDIPTLDPHKSTSTITPITFSLVYNSLVDLGKNLEVLPSLAERWEVSADGLTWTFHLRPGVKFHNGRPLEAKDVQFSIERILNPETGARGRKDLGLIETMTVIDPQTIAFRLKEKSGVFLTKLVTVYQAILPAESVHADGTITHPIGTGPFAFVEWKTNDHIKLKRAPEYWEKGLPYLDEILLKPIPDGTVRLTALQRGDVDMITSVPPEQLKQLMDNPSKDYTIQLIEGGGGQAFVIFNTQKPPFDNLKVRQAAAFAVNKQQFVLGVWRGFAVPVNQNFHPSSPWYLPVEDRVTDLDKARALLKEAGYPNGFKTTMTVAQVTTLPTVAQIFQAQMRQIGMDISLELFDWGAYIQKQKGLDFSITNTGFFPKVDPDDAYMRYFHSQGGVHELSGGYKNPELDALLEKGASTIDEAERKEIYTRVVEIIQEEVPVIFIASSAGAMGWRNTVKGFEPHMISFLSYVGGGLQKTWLEK